jgi:hypothetical protein
MAFANRGSGSEKKVKEFLEAWQEADTHREFSRLTDAKAAGRIIKAAAADFEYFCALPKVNSWGRDDGEEVVHGLIEVKETEHEYRLGRDRLTQLARLRKRNKCGGTCYVVVYHSTLKAWRVLRVGWLTNNGDKGSWDLRCIPTYSTCQLAMHAEAPEVF